MPGPLYLTTAVAVSTAVTWSLRALPFAVPAPLRRSAAVGYLAANMPVGVMLILALYTLRPTATAGWPTVLSAGLALATAIGLHLKFRNAVLSVLGATTLNVVLLALLSP